MKHIRTAWREIDVADGTRMRVYIAHPDDTGPHKPCVIVLQEAFGVNGHIREVTERIAALGYVAAAPELFHRTAPGFEGDYTNLGLSKPHMSALSNTMIEDDVNAVAAWFKTEPQADTETLAVVGFCLGGKAAFIANAVLPLKGAVSFYGSSIPSLLNDYAARQQAHLALVWGGKDKHLTPEERNQVDATLRKEGKVFTRLEFSDAEHGFFCDARSAYHPEAAREAWAFLAVYLKNRLPTA